MEDNLNFLGNLGHLIFYSSDGKVCFCLGGGGLFRPPINVPLKIYAYVDGVLSRVSSVFPKQIHLGMFRVGVVQKSHDTAIGEGTAFYHMATVGEAKRRGRS